RLRVRKQPSAAGGPHELPAIALEPGDRLAARPTLVPGRTPGGTRHAPRIAARLGSPGRLGPGHAMRPGNRIPYLPHRGRARAARPRAGELAGPATGRELDPPGLQPADRGLVRHGRGAIAHRATHGTGTGLAAAVAGDRT